MKVVLLSLVLGLVYSQEPQPEQYPSQVPGMGYFVAGLVSECVCSHRG